MRIDAHVHMGMMGEKPDREEFLKRLKEAGMDGAAVFSPSPSGNEKDYRKRLERVIGFTKGEELLFPFFFLDPTQEDAHSQMEDALEAVLERHPDCLLCGDDRLAFDISQELHARHIRVPQDLRVASLYDSELLIGITPSVSAVQYDAERLGSTACRMLLDLLAGKEIQMRQVQGYQVILRDSTK